MLQKKRVVTRASNNKRKGTNSSRASAVNNKNTVVKKDNSQRNYELTGLVMVALGLIALCGIAGFNVGFVGLKAAKFLQYFFGVGAILSTAALIGVGGYYIMRHQHLVINARMLGWTAFLTCSIAMYHHFVIKEGAEILPESLVDGGGLLGGLITILLHNIVGLDGTTILLGAGMLASILVATTWSLAQGILSTKEKAEMGAVAAKKATAVVYDKTLEVGEKTKEQVQEYVSAAAEDVGDKLKSLRSKQFLARYEQESAFLNEEEFDSAPEPKVKTAEKAAASVAVSAFAPAAVAAAASIAPEAVDANPLTETNELVSDFFGEKFFTDVEPEELPSLAAQLGLEEKAVEIEEAEEIPLKAPVADNEDIMEIVNGNHLAAINKPDEESPVCDAPDKTDACDEIEDEDAFHLDAAAEVQSLWESAWNDSQPDEEIPEYDYGLEDMEISYPMEAEDVTANLPDIEDTLDGIDEIEDIAKIAVPAAVATSSVPKQPAMVAEKHEAVSADEQAAPAPPPYILPSLHLLKKSVKVMSETLNQEIANNAKILGETLSDFKVKASILNACHGPAVTRYEVKPAPGVKVSKITGLADDIALNMAATAVRIEQIPGKAAIGIEVPNRDLESVQLREVLENPAFESAKSKLTVGLGKDISGQAIFADLAKMPHLLVAGATGSGKSVCINTLITSVLFKAKPDEVKFILIDPKMVELSVYNDIPHLMVPVVTDARKAASVLNWAVQEMEKRYGLIAEVGVRNMAGYNKLFEEMPEKQLPSIVIIIDELADLMMVAPHDVEDAICRIAQKARAAGIYLVLATQRPSVNVITGVIKANIPSRISFAVTSQIDSRTILDASGAEKLLGKGDMLFKPQEANKAVRIQGAFVSDQEVEMLVEYIKGQGYKLEANQEIIDFTNRAAEGEEKAAVSDKDKVPKVKIDTLLRDAVELTMSSNNASASSFQRRYHIGYSRAGRLIDTMEQLGIVGPPQGSKPREILVTEAQAFEIMDNYESNA